MTQKNVLNEIFEALDGGFTYMPVVCNCWYGKAMKNYEILSLDDDLNVAQSLIIDQREYCQQ